jgi:tetratricopeptide (TPR) repeat protein
MPPTLGSRDELGLALSFLRKCRGWEQEDLARASGIHVDSIQAIEQGRRESKVRTLGAITAALGVSLATIAETVSLVRRVRDAAASGETTAEQAAGQAAGSTSLTPPDLARRLSTLLVAQLSAGISPTAASTLEESRRQAPALWARLAGCLKAGREALVREAPEFQTCGLCELLCEDSRNAAGDNAEWATALAELAVQVAERVPGSEAWRSRLLGYARAHLANAMRVGGDLPAAEAEFARAELLWLAGAAADPGLLNEARVLHLKASLRRDQRHLDQALALLDTALAIDRWGETTSLLLGKAMALEALGEFEPSLSCLLQVAAQVDGEREPWLSFVVRNNVALSLCRLGRHAEAEQMLPEVRALAAQMGKQLESLRVLWVEGLVAAGLGRAEEAIGILERVRAEFDERQIAFDTALVTLELAEVHATLGHTAKVKALARESAPVFHGQGVHPEARRALELFCRAAEEERATAELLRRVVAYLYRARHDPRLRFETARPDPRLPGARPRDRRPR